jgi:hypothetical protein
MSYKIFFKRWNQMVWKVQKQFKGKLVDLFICCRFCRNGNWYSEFGTFLGLNGSILPISNHLVSKSVKSNFFRGPMSRHFVIITPRSNLEGIWCSTSQKVVKLFNSVRFQVWFLYIFILRTSILICSHPPSLLWGVLTLTFILLIFITS